MTAGTVFLRRNSKMSKLKRVRIEIVQGRMRVDTNVMEEIKKKQLIGFGHTKRMDDSKWLKRIL